MSLLVDGDVEAKALELVKKASFELVSQEDYEGVVALTKAIKEVSKEIEGAFKAAIDAAHKSWKAALGARDKYLDPLKEADGILRKSMSAWQTKQQAILRAAQIKAIKEAEAQQASLARIGIEDTVVPVVPVAQKTEGVSYRDSLEVEIIDGDMIPREYLMVDLSKLMELARKTKGSIEVPGVRFVNKQVAVIR